MKWNEARQHHPNTWLLIEAIQARSEKNKRILDNLAILNAYADSMTALKAYGKLHREFPQRELYVYHTANEQITITERNWFGL